MASAPHLPVLYQTIITALEPKSGGRYIDGTLGAGGHAAGILAQSSPSGELLGLDLDPQALAIAHERLAPFGERAHIVQASYTAMKIEAAKLAWDAVDGIILDFGVSSMQLDTPERGFSFLHSGPLDMRFTPNAPVSGAGTLSAADLVNTLPEDELANIIFRYGEERLSRKIARTIVNNRPIYTTTELADLILKYIGKKERIHPATRTFQALRIAVNNELESVEMVLPLAVMLLKPGGRLAVISFHSLEDRLTKEYFRRESVDCICPPKQPICTCNHKAIIKELNRKPIEADEAEKQDNSRSRSAKLRMAEKL
ncbi:MAG: 16S rRNA (cytosine(1402)-N(4))-methyltransferase RsmH [Chloroflexi bacterium]|nr:16S rRNA (cytosine(1402)-N(4))-methyltransferase RsmH [Chloroflexota bacterium]